MLVWLRDNAKSGFLKIVLLGFLVGAGGGLILMDVGGFFSGGNFSNNTVVKAGDISISSVEFDRIARRVLSRQQIGMPEAYQAGLMHMIARSEVQNRLLARESSRLGLRVGDDEVVAQIAQMTASLQPQGSRKDALQQVLRSQGISEGEFIGSIRQEMATTLLQAGLGAGATVASGNLVRALYQYDKEKRTVEAIVLPNASVKGIEAPDDAALQSYYEMIKAEYAIPETRTITIATLRREALESQVDVTDEELREIYDNSADLFTQPERRALDQAVLPTQKEAEDVRAKLAEKKTLKEAVQSVTGSESAYVGRQEFERGGLLEDIAGPAFTASKGDVIGPVQTALGWHVLVVSDILEPDMRSFASVKAGLKKDILDTRLADEMINAANTIDDRLAGGEELETLVREMGLTTEKIGPFRANGMNAGGKDLLKSYESDKAGIIENAFSLGAGEIAPVMELADGQLIVIRADDAAPQSFTPFEDVKAEIMKKWVAQQQELTNRVRADDALAALQSGKAALADKARELGGSVRTFTLGRIDEPKAPVSRALIDKAFVTPVGAFFLASGDNGYMIAQVKNAALPDPSKAGKDDLETVAGRLAATVPQERLLMFISAAGSDTDIRINERALAAMYGQPQ